MVGEQTLNKMLVGGIAFFLLFMLHAFASDVTGFTDFIKWSIGGTLLSALFLVPMFRILVSKKFETKDLISIVFGTGLLLIYMVYMSPIEVLIFVLQWATIYAFISVLITLFHKEIQELISCEG